MRKEKERMRKKREKNTKRKSELRRCNGKWELEQEKETSDG